MTDPASFWSGPFGDEYSRRNVGLVERNVAFLARALARARNPIRSVLEFGCGTGQNLQALKTLMPNAETVGIEVNAESARAAAQIASYTFRCDALSWRRPEKTHWDLVLSKGFLIHVPPERIRDAYFRLFDATGRYLLLAEYYAPKRTMIPYRGEVDKLWKANFYGELLAAHPSLHLVDYGFIGHWDPFPQDDLNWWLLEKR